MWHARVERINEGGECGSLLLHRQIGRTQGYLPYVRSVGTRVPRPAATAVSVVPTRAPLSSIALTSGSKHEKQQQQQQQGAMLDVGFGGVDECVRDARHDCFARDDAPKKTSVGHLSA